MNSTGIYRKKGILVSAIFLVLFASLRGQKDDRDTILFFHPTIQTISTIDYLLNNGILDLEEFHFTGVCSTSEAYDYSMSESYIQTLIPGRYSLVQLSENVSREDVFNENAWSPAFNNLFEQSVGALFFGGPDIPPALYGEPTSTLTIVSDPGRHYLELSFIYHILGNYKSSALIPLINEAPDYVISGICLGMQTINVATGGTLIQDLPSEIYGLKDCEEITMLDKNDYHRNYLPQLDLSAPKATGYHFHAVRVVEDGPLDFNLSEPGLPEILSSHHQAVENKGKGIKIAAWSPDGKIVEAISHEKYPGILGVQFHPENTGLYDPQRTYIVSSDSTINFNEHIKNQYSMDFHMKYWSYVSSIIHRSSAEH